MTRSQLLEHRGGEGSQSLSGVPCMEREELSPSLSPKLHDIYESLAQPTGDRDAPTGLAGPSSLSEWPVEKPPSRGLSGL